MPKKMPCLEDYNHKIDFFHDLCEYVYNACLKMARRWIIKVRGLAYLHRHEDLEVDIAHNVVCKLLDRYEQINDPKAIWGWLKVSIYRELLDYLAKEAMRRDRFQSLLDGEVVGDGSSQPIDTLCNDEAIAQVHAELSALTDLDRHIILDHYFGFKSRNEISESEGVSYDKVSRTIHRFVAAMRKVFERNAESIR